MFYASRFCQTNQEAQEYLMPPVRIAMWSGPRNISTALMRAWENRTIPTLF